MKTLNSPRHKALCAYLIGQREAAGLTQQQVAEAIGRYQSFVARVESGQKVLDVVELLDFAEVIGFNPRDAVSELLRFKR